MLQRQKVWQLHDKLREKNISLYDLCREVDRFTSLMNHVDLTDNFVEKINLLRKAESSIKTILNMVFSEMNPQLNPLIKEDDEGTGNYNSLLLRLEKLIVAIGSARDNLIIPLKSKIDIETNVITNNANISFFISTLAGIFSDLIYHSLKRATENVLLLENPSVEFARDKETDDGKKKIRSFVIPQDNLKILFDYLVYAYFLRTSQSSVPIFSNIKYAEASVKTPPPEAREFQKMITPKQSTPPAPSQAPQGETTSNQNKAGSDHDEFQEEDLEG